MNAPSATLKDGKQISVEDKDLAPTSQDVVLKNTTSQDVTVYDFGDDAGVGMEDVKKSEFIVPFLSVLQSNSPEVDEQDGMPGAAPGMLINKGTKVLYDIAKKGPLTIIPVRRDHNFPEFTPRDAGGGFHGLKAPNDPEVLGLKKEQGDYGKLKTERNTELTETFYLYCILVDYDGMESRIVLGFASTQIKKYQQFMGRTMDIQYPGPNDTKVNPPIWAHRWKLGVAKEQNKKGKFFGWTLTLDGERPHDALIKRHERLYLEAKSFNEMLKTGEAKAAAPDQKGGAGNADVDEEIPF